MEGFLAFWHGATLSTTTSTGRSPAVLRGGNGDLAVGLANERLIEKLTFIGASL
ncbi:hypothetical protein R6258_10130 [Halomonas sp. HP20-15]|uniref:hypothetical protein n=1 Tax=Halomonas sp. HP20-15 TaxID=3085901 RepID=UPI002981DF33|nr:hypothetical protein [Halomonas sp. HP20-15]MDW5377273.1 hypothetical protein [Halomonas sp. HP20-15]